MSAAETLGGKGSYSGTLRCRAVRDGKWIGGLFRRNAIAKRQKTSVRLPGTSLRAS